MVLLRTEGEDYYRPTRTTLSTRNYHERCDTGNMYIEDRYRKSSTERLRLRIGL